MLSRVHAMADREAQLDDYLFIPIDTNQEDLDREKPTGGRVRDIGLEKPISRWQSNRSAFFYLDEDYQIERQEGTGQSRPVSRYHVDSPENISRMIRILRNEITGFIGDKAVANDAKGSDFDVWIVNSLGGGTGSGSFPIVTALVHNVASSMTETPAINGIGSLPRLDEVNPLVDPKGSNKLYANSYAALAELRAMLNDYGDDDWETPSVELLEEGQELTPSSVINDNVEYFSNYWLIGFSEQEASSSGYRRRMNRIAAQMIHYYGNKDQIEDFPFEYDHLKDEPLAAVSTGRLYVPIDDLREHITLREEIDTLTAEIDTLTAEIDANRELESYYQEVLGIQLRTDGIPQDLTRVNRAVLTDCRNVSSDVEPATDVSDVEVDGYRPDREAIREQLQDHIDATLNANRADIWTPDPVVGGDAPDVDKESVVAYFYCDELAGYLRDVLAEHRFADEIEELWNGEFEETIRDYASPNYARHDNSPPDIKWETTLEEFISDYGSTLVEQKSDSLNPVTRYKLGNEIDTLRRHNNVLPDLYEQYKKIKTYLDIVETRAETARDTLRDARDRVQHRVDDKQDEKADKHRERDGNQRSLTNLTADLSGPPGDRRHNGEYRPPISRLESLTRADVYPVVNIGSLLDTTDLSEDDVRPTLEAADAVGDESLREVDLPEPEFDRLGIADAIDGAVPDDAYASRPSLASLVADGFIAQADLVTELTDLLNDAAVSGDPVQDITIEPPVEIDTKTFLGVVSHRDNVHEDGPVGNVLELDAGGQPSATEEMDSLEIDYIAEPVGSADRFSVQLLSWFLPIALENTHEFGRLNRHFTADTSTIEEGLHISNLTDEYVARSFAYPEIISDTEVWQRFEMLSDRTP